MRNPANGGQFSTFLIPDRQKLFHWRVAHARAHFARACLRGGGGGRYCRKFRSEFCNLTPPYSADSGRKINFQALRARAAESLIIRKDDVAAVLADHAAVGENGHGVERFIDYAVGTTRFVRHRRWPHPERVAANGNYRDY
jgi:hypothetical protein